MLEIPSKIIALLCEFNDDTTKSARYVRSWPPAVEPVTKKEYEDFYERIGEGDVRLGQESKLLFFVNSYRFLIQFVDAISHFFFSSSFLFFSLPLFLLVVVILRGDRGRQA